MDTSRRVFLFALFICGFTIWTAAAEDTRVVFGEVSNLNISKDPITHMEPDLYQDEPGGILFSWGSSLKTARLGSLPDTVVGSIDTSGYADGDASKVMFNHIRNFLQIAKDEVIIVDLYNACLRHLDRTTKFTSPYVGDCTKKGYANGVGTNALFNFPSSVMFDERDRTKLIVVDDGSNSLRSINMATKEVSLLLKNDSVLLRPRFAIFDSEDNNTLYVTVQYQLLKISLSDAQITVISGVSSPGGPFSDGTLSEGQFGIYTAEVLQLNPTSLLVADYWQHEVRLLDLAHNQFTSICLPRVNDSLIHGVGCGLKYVHSLLLHNDTLYVGDINAIHKIPVASIPINAVDHFAAAKCESRRITVALLPGERLAKIEIAEGVSLLAGVGEMQYVHTENGFDCIVYIQVKAADIQRRVEFQVDYMFDCNSFNNAITKNLVDSMTENNFINLLEICEGVCTKKQNSKPIQTCANNKLTVVYATNLVYSAEVTDIPKDISDILTNKLISKGAMMTLVDTQKVPPVIYPVRLANGASAKLLFTTSCLNGKTYDATTDTC